MTMDDDGDNDVIKLKETSKKYLSKAEKLHKSDMY